MSRRSERQQQQDAALLAVLQRQAALVKLRQDAKVRAALVTCDRLRFDPAYRLSRLDLVAPR